MCSYSILYNKNIDPSLLDYSSNQTDDKYYYKITDLEFVKIAVSSEIANQFLWRLQYFLYFP